MMDINNLVSLAAGMHASDIHISSGMTPKCRVDGAIKSISDELLDEKTVEEIARHLLGDNFDRVAKIGEADIGFTFPCGVRVRGNIYRQNRRLSIALRLFNNRIPTVEELGLPACAGVIPSIKNGIVLVTGETGAGKSTTLAAILDRINHTRDGHIITLEDPIEYIFEPDRCIISQREVGVDTATFANGLRSVLREDPDVIMIGEMRDLETIEAALTAAETGHLVLATLHTNSASDTLDRIVGVFPEGAQAQIRMQLSNTLHYVISQKLLPKADGTGRVLACEVMAVNTAFRNLIREGKTHQIDSFISLTTNEGSISMDAALQKLVMAGSITLEVAQQYARNKETLRLGIKETPSTSNEKGFFKKK